MIKFKEHDGLLFKMLDKPVPLTPDAEMPCIIAPIQDDSPMGRYVKQCWGHDKLFMREYTICNINADMAAKVGVAKDTPLSIYMFEIIGTLVKEGSAEWALYQMMQGKCVCHVKAPSIKYHKPTHYVKRVVRENCTDDMSDAVWMKGADHTGWQLYEPKPESENIIHGYIPADMRLKYIHLFKVGDWVEHKESKEQATIRRIMSYGAIEIEFAYSTESDIYQANDFYNDFRKLSPSEVIVKIGCLSGTIAKSSDPNHFLMLHSRPITDCNYSIIRFSAIDTETREIVEGLLKAQEEEK